MTFLIILISFPLLFIFLCLFQLEMRISAKKGLDIEKVLEVCKLNGINKLMIEGGAAIISSILNQVSDNPILNILIVTVSPYMVGEGIGIKSSNIDSLSLLRHLETKIMGLDAVFAYTTTSATDG
ncbi:hypothetical protein MJO29_001813 [Puccinia striiformis f. sp. tritici]|nr:hypothetical protein MJO29_001813 [Puccinia striiformis f. sp. tritici]